MHAAAGLSTGLSVRRQTATRVPGAAARLASCKVQLDSAAKILPSASSAWSQAGGARQTFMHPHTLSHRTNMYSSTVTHLHTQWHVNRHSQYTPKITPNSETVKLKFSCTMDSESLFYQSSTAEALIRENVLHVSVTHHSQSDIKKVIK